MPNIVYSQQFILTSAVFLLAAGSFAGLAIKDRKPRTTLKPSLLPTIPLQLVAGSIAIFALMALVVLLKPST